MQTGDTWLSLQTEWTGTPCQCFCGVLRFSVLQAWPKERRCPPIKQLPEVAKPMRHMAFAKLAPRKLYHPSLCRRSPELACSIRFASPPKSPEWYRALVDLASHFYANSAQPTWRSSLRDHARVINQPGRCILGHIAKSHIGIL